jgi:hypothetical protein
MFQAGGLARPRSTFLRQLQDHGALRLASDLLAPALLLGLLRVWSLTTAPKQGVYFFAEALLIAYAYFVIARAAYIHTQSRDWEGRYDLQWHLKARGHFYAAVLAHRLRIALLIVPLLCAALILDFVTADSGFQLRPNLHLSVMFVALMAWARYGAAIVLASARWSPPRPLQFDEARELASRAPVARSFALLNLGFGAVALAALSSYKWAGAHLPTARAELICLIVVFTALAWLALWLHCRWAVAMLVRVGEMDSSKATTAREAITPPAQQDCPEPEPRVAPHMVAPICHGTNSLSP